MVRNDWNLVEKPANISKHLPKKERILLVTFWTFLSNNLCIDVSKYRNTKHPDDSYLSESLCLTQPGRLKSYYFS